MNRLIPALVAFVATTVTTSAQEWPNRPISMVVPFGAGTSADLLGRILASGLSQTLGQQVIVENVGGAGGMNGANRVAKAKPDGYQFVVGAASTHAFSQTLYKNPLYNAATDFTPVMLVSEIPLLLVTRKDLPVSDLPGFITYVTANHAKMQYGSSGAGSVNHVGCLLLNSAIGVDVTHVPYRNGGITDLIAGRIDYYCQLAPAAVPQIESGQIKGIATLSKSRTPILPNLRTAQEQGLTSFDAGNWNAVFLPPTTPATIVRKLHAATVSAIEIPSVQQRMKEAGAEIVAPERRSPEYLQKFVESEIVKWGAPIKAAGVTGE